MKPCLSNKIVMHAISVVVILLELSLVRGQLEPWQVHAHTAVLTPSSSQVAIHLHWSFDDKEITFEVQARTTGWIGIGFSSKGSMVGADIVIGWVKNGQVTVTDRHGLTPSNTFPPKDDQQDLTEIKGEEANGWTRLQFTRQLAACESGSDREITEGTNRVIWAYGTSDPNEEDIEPSNYHGPTNRGSKSLILLLHSHSQTNQDFTGPGYMAFNVTAMNLALPTKDTYYNCRFVKLPDLPKKHHIIKLEPVIQSGNEPYVHHMILFKCPDNWNPIMNQFQTDADFACSATMDTPCREYLAGWAVGGGPRITPPEAGIPIGGKSSSQYVMLETHYDNQARTAGIVDSSGMRTIYTSALRKHDSSVFVVAQITNAAVHYIPPQAESFTTVALCGSKCVKQKLAEAAHNLTVFGAFLHSHLAGRKMKLRQFRNGTELRPLAFDANYDFNYQEFIPLNPYATIVPGDTLQMECTFSTIGRSKITEGGEGTMQEMCIGFISYYPKVEDLTTCASFVQPRASLKYFGIPASGIKTNTRIPESLSEINITHPEIYAGKTALEVVNEYNWTTESIAGFESFLHRELHTQVCSVKRGTPVVVSMVRPIIDPDVPYISPERKCSSGGSMISPINTTTLLLISVALIILLGASIRSIASVPGRM